DEMVPWTEALKRLIQKLQLCAELKEALGSGGTADSRHLVKGLRVCQLEFRKRQQQWKAAGGEFKDLEDVFRRVEAVDALASAEQISLVAREISQQAVAMVKCFDETLRTRK